jgi:hypothetical protein
MGIGPTCTIPALAESFTRTRTALVSPSRRRLLIQNKCYGKYYLPGRDAVHFVILAGLPKSRKNIPSIFKAEGWQSLVIKTEGSSSIELQRTL